MKLHTFDELDAMAWNMLGEDAYLKKAAELVPTERLAVLQLAFAMALCKLGVLSPKASGAFKLWIYRENKQFAVEFNHLYTIYERWAVDTRDTSVLRSAYDKAMRNNQEHEALGLASVIIGKLTGEGNVHYQLYERYCTDKDCRAQTEQAARDVLNPKNDNEYDDRLPYTTIVDSMFRFFSTERMIKLWEQLGVDYPDPVKTKIPSKRDDTDWAVNMIAKICGKVKDTRLPDVQEEQALPECKQNVPLQSVQGVYDEQQN